MRFTLNASDDSFVHRQLKFALRDLLHAGHSSRTASKHNASRKSGTTEMWFQFLFHLSQNIAHARLAYARKRVSRNNNVLHSPFIHDNLLALGYARAICMAVLQLHLLGDIERAFKSDGYIIGDVNSSQRNNVARVKSPLVKYTDSRRGSADINDRNSNLF